LFGLDEVRDPRGEHAGLACAGPGDEEGVGGSIADDAGLEGVWVIGPEGGGGFLFRSTGGGGRGGGPTACCLLLFSPFLLQALFYVVAIILLHVVCLPLPSPPQRPLALPPILALLPFFLIFHIQSPPLRRGGGRGGRRG